MKAELAALLGDEEIGLLHRDWRGRLSFAYADTWRTRPDAYPLSVSMPLAEAEHAGRSIEAFVHNLLPDDPAVRDVWARKFHLPDDDLMALLTTVGEDCAGAVRFVPPERVAELREGKTAAVEWLDSQGLAERVRDLWGDPSKWHRGSDPGKFTLAGAQAKTAFFSDGERFGIPSGGIPTTHIVKPGAFRYEAHAQNEHFCMSLARALELPVASSRIIHAEDEIAIAIERFDRRAGENGIIRVHQEDFCQAMMVMPAEKYEADGGPSPKKIVELIRAHSLDPDQDVGSFVAALVFNWLIAGSDGHAKNYSLFVKPGGKVSHAPLYDLSSALPYAKEPTKVALSMAIGGHERLNEIGPAQWRRLFRELALEEEAVKAAMMGMADCLPDFTHDVQERMKAEGLEHPLLDKLAAAITERAKVCSADLRAWPPLSKT